ncbi:MAG: bifunctional pyr operon transcriptional regulator/uracil phosphoribosyltransferase PyrR [Chlamydiae bacterium]|nr:bifunctional pyr operon transcriptional regulator/uracil phosphoribosyltransferase PyrR [Chlamydiota bacterium]MBI3277859.1 bifunctional pyr operon transcriptional regulator/uracil phosphoribosyltransferase PyrR [Chlamydiota bacterium]
MEKSKLMDAQTLSRTLMRISHEILERNKDLSNLVLIGIQTRGTHLAKRIQKNLSTIEGIKIPMGYLDISLYRDDLNQKGAEIKVQKTEISFDLNGKNIILVDDVLFSGRTIRAAIDELMDFGRPERIQLAVLIDRGHRELPIRPDYVGKNVPTSLKEEIQLFLTEVDGKDEVELR